MGSVSTRFVPGQSGNPGGRKAIPEELKVRLRSLSGRAVDALECALDSKDDRVRIHAATALLDRAYGKPAQQADLTVTAAVDASQAHLQALVDVARRRERLTALERSLPRVLDVDVDVDREAMNVNAAQRR